MNPFKVLVYDDESNIADNLASSIESARDGATAEVADKEDFQELMYFISRRMSALRHQEDCDTSDSHPADDADVVVVDYDLFEYRDEKQPIDMTGSRLAYLMRCFLKCGFIIILNKERSGNPFHLTLGSPTEDFADLHVSSMQIGNPGLWHAPFEGFRPWYWPLVPNARENFEQCVRDVHENLDVPIVNFLGLDRVIDWIPRRAQDFLEGRETFDNVTFRSFAKVSSGIDPKDELRDEQKYRVAASRIVILLNSIILPEQGVLVDAPHLVSRFPSLLQSANTRIETWNLLCNPVESEIDSLLNEDLRKYRFGPPHWLWRPAWYWPEINGDEEIEEVQNPWAIQDVDWVFCEDISKFVPIGVAQEFRALVAPPFTKRYIFDRNVESAQRYVRQLDEGGVLDPRQIDYVPQSALSA